MSATASTAPPRQRRADDLADVVRDPMLDGAFVVPFAHADAHAAMRIVRDALGMVSVRRSASGIQLDQQGAEALLAAEHRLPFRWTEDARRFVLNRIRAHTVIPGVWDSVQVLRSGGAAAATAHLGQRGYLAALDDHQLVNVAAMTLPGSPGLCLFDEQGAGKTVSMIFAFDELVRRDEVDFMLIAAPKSMLGEWPKDFTRFTDDTYAVRVLDGSRPAKLAQLSGATDVLIANFETIVSMEPELQTRIKQYGGRAVIAVDESFFIKSPDARRTMALRRLREWADRGFVLCGTPAPNSPTDVVQQFNFADFGYAFQGVQLPADREEALPLVQKVVDERGLYVRNLKLNVLPDLPGKTFNRVSVEMEPRQQELYQRALKSLAEDLQQMTDEQFRRQITNFLARRAALLQLCSNPAGVAEGYDGTPAKLAALDDIVERIVVGQREKLVIWSFYTGTIDRIMRRYSHLGAIRYDGTVSSVQERRDAVSKFQTDDQTMVLVANPAAAGAGLTLHRARYAVYESMSNQAAHYLQSLDRIHRRGQTRPVEYIVLLCQGSIEEEEYGRLLRKEAAAQHLLGDVVEPPLERAAMLAETLALLQVGSRKDPQLASSSGAICPA